MHKTSKSKNTVFDTTLFIRLMCTRFLVKKKCKCQNEIEFKTKRLKKIILCYLNETCMSSPWREVASDYVVINFHVDKI